VPFILGFLDAIRPSFMLRPFAGTPADGRIAWRDFNRPKHTKENKFPMIAGQRLITGQKKWQLGGNCHG
jgi:hypothetical protein